MSAQPTITPPWPATVTPAWTPDYELAHEPVARGGQSSVFAARAPDGRPVAIKLAHPAAAACEAVRREAGLLRLVAAYGVTGIVPVETLLHIDSRPGIVMPMYPTHLGRWLAHAHVAPDRFTLDHALTLLMQLAGTVHDLHGKKLAELGGFTLVHRDIKPDNVLLDARGVPFLGDFGSAVAADGRPRLDTPPSDAIAWAPVDQLLPGLVLPTPTWDDRALAALAFAALAGRRPSCHVDPRPWLTVHGTHLWDLLQRARASHGVTATRLHRQFEAERQGTSAADVLCGTPHLTAADRDVLTVGLRRLAAPLDLDERQHKAVFFAVWRTLVQTLGSEFMGADGDAKSLGDGLRSALTPLTDTCTPLSFERRFAPPAIPQSEPEEPPTTLPEPAPSAMGWLDEAIVDDSDDDASLPRSFGPSVWWGLASMGLPLVFVAVILFWAWAPALFGPSIREASASIGKHGVDHGQWTAEQDTGAK